jgi:hypothetical protein
MMRFRAMAPDVNRNARRSPCCHQLGRDYRPFAHLCIEGVTTLLFAVTGKASDFAAGKCWQEVLRDNLTPNFWTSRDPTGAEGAETDRAPLERYQLRIAQTV